MDGKAESKAALVVDTEKGYARRHNGLAGKLTKFHATGLFKAGPKFWGAHMKRNKLGYHAPGAASRGGKRGGAITGPKNAALKRGICNPEVQSRAGRKGGAVNVELALGMFAPEKKGLGLHVRYHVNRQKFNPACIHCSAEMAARISVQPAA